MQEEELCNIAIPMCICRLTLTWISSENSTTHEECWLILTGLPSLRLDPISSDWSLLSGVDSICHSPSPVANWLLWVPSSNSTRVPLPTSGHVDISSPNPLSGFVPKQTKGSSAWRTTYIVLHKKALAKFQLWSGSNTWNHFELFVFAIFETISIVCKQIIIIE